MIARRQMLRSPSCPLLLAALVALAGCGGGPTPGPPEKEAARRGGTAVLGSISDVDSWNEYLSRQTFANNLHRRIFLRLAQEMGDTQDHPPTYAPLLAESWTPSLDGKAITFRLRRAEWSDGHPVTASDVRFTWKAQTAPDVAWIGASGKKHVLDVEAADERTVIFRFDRPYPDQFADAVDGGILPEHVFRRVPFKDWRTHDWSSAKVGSGPFLLERHAPAEEIVLVRNPRYFAADLPRLDRVVIRIVPDASSLLTQLLAGAVDYMEGIAPREATRVGTAPGVKLIPFNYPMYDYLGWNCARPPFDDPEIRRALTLAIDRQALVDDLLYGFGRVSAGPLLSFWWGADPALRPWPYSPDEARRILTSRGFVERKTDGVLVREGRALEFALTTNAGNRLREAVLVKIQEQLARIGVRVHPRSEEMQAFVHRNTQGDFDAYVGGWRFAGKLEIESIFGSASVPPRGNNVARYRSAEVDRLVGVLAGASGWEATRPILGALEQQIHTDQPYTFLYETQRLAAAGPRLHGVEIDVPSDPLARLERYWVDP